ncbi:hypothetical protein FPRO04_12304 [Fusarium proliferatum]|nr:hypothetical protein FPRO04_12304 [Fusarium proliferatum]
MPLYKQQQQRRPKGICPDLLMQIARGVWSNAIKWKVSPEALKAVSVSQDNEDRNSDDDAICHDDNQDSANETSGLEAHVEQQTIRPDDKRKEVPELKAALLDSQNEASQLKAKLSEPQNMIK